MKKTSYKYKNKINYYAQNRDYLHPYLLNIVKYTKYLYQVFVCCKNTLYIYRKFTE